MFNVGGMRLRHLRKAVQRRTVQRGVAVPPCRTVQQAPDRVDPIARVDMGRLKIGEPLKWEESCGLWFPLATLAITKGCPRKKMETNAQMWQLEKEQTAATKSPSLRLLFKGWGQP